MLRSKSFLTLTLSIGLAIGGSGLLTTPASAAEKLLYAFQGGGDGGSPNGGLIMDKAGNLYGTTSEGGGGKHCLNGHNGCGTVFKIAPDGTETVLHSFMGSCDGAFPNNGLVADKSGNMYGVTYGGGICGGRTGNGVLFKVTPDGIETVLHAFTGDFESASGALLIDGQGNLFGSVFGGGPGYIFKLSATGDFSQIYAFKGGDDGAGPLGDLIQDKAGNIYGTTYEGGNANCQGYGCGTVFKLAPDGSETVLYAFQNGADGSAPNGGVVMDKAGNLYGTTSEGDSHVSLVFKLAPDGTETVLHAFPYGSTDGWQLFAGVVMDKQGMLYGSTYRGGDLSCGKGFGCGTVFKLMPDGEETVLIAFNKTRFGREPFGDLLLGKDGDLYGTTLDGGAYKSGVVFRVNK